MKKNERIPLIPKSIKIHSVVNYGEQERDLLIFNAFEAQNTETHVLAEYDRSIAGELYMKVVKARECQLVIQLSSCDPLPGGAVTSIPSWIRNSCWCLAMEPGQQVDVMLTYATKGMDVFRYNLSEFQGNVIEGLQADVKLNTNEFEIYRFGLPHTTDTTADRLNRFDSMWTIFPRPRTWVSHSFRSRDIWIRSRA